MTTQTTATDALELLEFLALLQVGEWAIHHGIVIERISRDGLDKFHVHIDGREHPAATSNAAVGLAEQAAAAANKAD